MKRLLIAFCFMLAATPALAQNTSPNSKFAWTQEADTLATAQAYIYRLYVDGGATPIPLTATCVDATPAGSQPTNPPTFNCEAPFPAFTPGTHNVRLTAGNASGESEPTPVVSFNLVVVPKTPTAFRIVNP